MPPAQGNRHQHKYLDDRFANVFGNDWPQNHPCQMPPLGSCADMAAQHSLRKGLALHHFDLERRLGRCRKPARREKPTTIPPADEAICLAVTASNRPTLKPSFETAKRVAPAWASTHRHHDAW
jgi:hypothetical protein